MLFHPTAHDDCRTKPITRGTDTQKMRCLTHKVDFFRYNADFTIDRWDNEKIYNTVRDPGADHPVNCRCRQYHS